MNKLFAVLLCLVFSSVCFANNSEPLDDDEKWRIENLSAEGKKKLWSARRYYEEVALYYSIVPGKTWHYPVMKGRKLDETLRCIELSGTVLLQVQIGKNGDKSVEVGCLFSN